MADLSTMTDEQLASALRAKLSAPPTPRKPTDSSFLRGVAAGAKEPLDRLAQRANSAFNLDSLSRKLGMPTADEAAAGGDAARANNSSMGGQIVGNMIGMAPTMAIKAPAAVVGGLEGAILSRGDDVSSVAEDALWGAGGAYIGDKAVRGVANAVSPKISAAVSRLTKEGVPLTPGEITGGRLKVAEDKLMSIPLLGDMISTSRSRGQTALERAAVNKALRPIGEMLPKEKAGRDAVTFAGDKLSQRYEALIPKLTANVDSTFVNRVNYTRKKLNLPPTQAAQFDDIIQREVATAFDPKTGTISGKKMKQVEERLNDLAASWGKSDDPFMRDLASGMQEVRGHVLGMLSRQNPRAAKELRAINKGWANLVPLENAVNVGEGVVTPGRLYQGVKAADKSVRKRGTTRARTELGRLALDATEVMSNRTPNSFTADRAAMALGTGGVMAGGGALLSPAMAAPGLLALPYAPGVRDLVQKAMTGRQGKIPKAAADYIRKASPFAVLGAPPLLTNPAYAEGRE